MELYLTPESQATITYWSKNLSDDFRYTVMFQWMQEIRRTWLDRIDGGFDAQRQPSGGPWMPLSPKYAAWKMRHGYPSLIGTLTGDLRSSMVGTVDVNKKQVTIRPWGVEYAGYFNAKRSFIPVRQVLENDAVGVFNSKVRRFARKVNA